MKVIAVIATFVVISMIDIPDLIKEKNDRIKRISLYSFFFIAGLTISILLVVEKAPISPSVIIEMIVKNIM